MADFNKPFNKILEQYLFSVSNKFIELADQETQSYLINLISQIDSTTGQVLDDPLRQLEQSSETEWEQVLSQPVNLTSVYNQWLIGITRQRVRRQEAYIAHIEETIRFAEQQGQLIQNKFLSEPLQAVQLNRNKEFLKQCQGYLAIAHTTKKALFDQLNRLIAMST